MQAEIDREYGTVLATLKGDWVRGHDQSPIGTFIAEAQREAAHADVAFMNTHGIRKDVPAGPLTRKDLLEILPFRNVLMTFQLSGADIRKALRVHLEGKASLQFAGITGTWTRNADGSADLLSVEVLGRPLEDSRMYVCARMISLWARRRSTWGWR